MYKKLFTSMFEGLEKEEKPIPKSPEKAPIYAGNNSNEDPDLVRDTNDQYNVDEEAAKKVLERIQRGVIKERAVSEDEKKKLLRVNHNKWIEGARDFIKIIGTSVTVNLVAYNILQQMGIDIPMYVLVAVTSPGIVGMIRKDKAKNS